MEVLSLVEEVVEEASKEMVANAVAPQSHEVQLIPVKKYSQTTEVGIFNSHVFWLRVLFGKNRVITSILNDEDRGNWRLGSDEV